MKDCDILLSLLNKVWTPLEKAQKIDVSGYKRIITYSSGAWVQIQDTSPVFAPTSPASVHDWTK